jgi:hypothetical protein
MDDIRSTLVVLEPLREVPADVTQRLTASVTCSAPSGPHPHLHAPVQHGGRDRPGTRAA